ncbi:hypothetical protein ACOMHN_004952 [Nucella lapillus]
MTSDSNRYQDQTCLGNRVKASQYSPRPDRQEALCMSSPLPVHWSSRPFQCGPHSTFQARQAVEGVGLVSTWREEQWWRVVSVSGALVKVFVVFVNRAALRGESVSLQCCTTH